MSSKWQPTGIKGIGCRQQIKFMRYRFQRRYKGKLYTFVLPHDSWFDSLSYNEQLPYLKKMSETFFRFDVEDTDERFDKRFDKLICVFFISFNEEWKQRVQSMCPLKYIYIINQFV